MKGSGDTENVDKEGKGNGGREGRERSVVVNVEGVTWRCSKKREMMCYRLYL